MNGVRHPHLIENVREFYESDVVIDTFNESFAGRWHTRVIPDAPGPKSSEAYVAGLLGLRPEHLLLDFGCGVGGVACSFARQIGCRVRGLNISAKQIGQARALAESEGLTEFAAFDVYDGGSLPYPDEVFDRLSFFESPCQVPDKAFLIREFFRILRPGSACAGQDWVVPSQPVSAADYSDWIHPIEASCEVALESLEHYKALFLDAGFTRVEITDARDIYRDLEKSFTPPNHEIMRVLPGDSMADRLMKGNLALSNAYHRGLFTIGFVRAEKPPRRTAVHYRVRPDGTDFETGTNKVYSRAKNVSVIQFHKNTFRLTDDPWLHAFDGLVRSAEGATTEASCKVSGWTRHSTRFNLFFHENTQRGYEQIRSYLAVGQAETGCHLDLKAVDEFVGNGLDFARVSKVVTGIDLRPSTAASRLKIWFMLSQYPERVDRAIRLQHADELVRRLIVHDRFLVGFDLHLDGRSSIKLYPDILPEELTDARVQSAFSDATLQAMALCSMTHVYFARPGAPVVLQFHPDEPDDFVRRYLASEPAEDIHSRYQGLRLLDMVVSLRETDLEGGATEFSLYYMPAGERLI